MSVTAIDYLPDLGRLTDLLEAGAGDYLAEKVKQLKEKGLENVSSIVKFGYGTGEIIGLAYKSPDTLRTIAPRPFLWSHA